MADDDDEAAFGAHELEKLSQFSGDTFTRIERKQIRQMLEADRFAHRFWTSFRVLATWAATIAGAATGVYLAIKGYRNP